MRHLSVRRCARIRLRQSRYLYRYAWKCGCIVWAERRGFLHVLITKTEMRVILRMKDGAKPVTRMAWVMARRCGHRCFPARRPSSSCQIAPFAWGDPFGVPPSSAAAWGAVAPSPFPIGFSAPPPPFVHGVPSCRHRFNSFPRSLLRLAPQLARFSIDFRCLEWRLDHLMT